MCRGIFCIKTARSRSILSERQIVGSILTTLRLRGERSLGCRSSILLRREGSRSSRSGCRSRTCKTGGGRHLLGNLATNDIESADIVEPTALILMRVNVKLNGDILTGLNIKLLDAVFTKDTEHHAARILARNLNDVVLAHP